MSTAQSLTTRLLIGLAFCWICATVNAQELTAADYVAMDLAVKQITVEGVEDRVLLVELGGSGELQMEQDREVQNAVEAIYARQGTTAAEAVAWATRHERAIQQYLADNPALQARYDALAKELDTLSARIQSHTQR